MPHQCVMREIASIEQLATLVGREVAVSDWMPITQQRISAFAEATDDRQWIHIDTERCQRESPYGCTIAHGFLTLSLVPRMMENALSMPDVRLSINYGLNKVRFPAPVPVDSRLRARFLLLAIDDIDGGSQIVWSVTLERDGSAKPVCVAEFVVRRYP
jgi:acyl dehydratase